MTATTDADDPDADDSDAVEERYSAIETADGEVVIYDRDETTAWLQSDYSLEVSA